MCSREGRIHCMHMHVTRAASDVHSVDKHVGS